MKVILAGLWGSSTYHESLGAALRRQGVEVIPFKTKETMKGWLGFIEKYLVFIGPLSRLCDHRFLTLCKREQPEIVFVWQYELLDARTIEKIRKTTNAKIVCYTNDDPFSPIYDSHRSIYVQRRWRIFKRAISFYDKHYVYRRHNIDEFKNAGAKDVALLYSAYNPRNEYPRSLSANKLHEFQCDVIFIGHFENGIKRECIAQLLEAGIDLKIFGHYGWDKPEASRIRSLYGEEIRSIWGEDYAVALSAAKIGLCFLSRLNRDEYTKRSFEIPACGTVLLAERTRTHQELYKEGIEAEFFKDAGECLNKVKMLLADQKHLGKVAHKGRKRLLKDRHSIDDRAKFLIAELLELCK